MSDIFFEGNITVAGTESKKRFEEISSHPEQEAVSQHRPAVSGMSKSVCRVLGKYLHVQHSYTISILQ